MRTKALILSAALVAAGVASSMAQSNVYSLNVVGYVNLPLVTGYNLITLPLQSSDPTSSINSVLTNCTSVGQGNQLDDYDYVFQFNTATSTFYPAVYTVGGVWYDQNFISNVNNSLPPGTAFFLNCQSPSTATVVGTVLQGTNTISLSPGYGFYGNFEPVQGDITTNGFPVTQDYNYLFLFNTATQKYNPAVYGFTPADSGTAPYPAFEDQNFISNVVVAPAVGIGFVYFSQDTTNDIWTQKFTVQ